MGRTCLGFVLGAGLLLAATTHAATVQFAATLDGAQETPPNGSAGTGSASLVMDTDANTLSGSVSFSGLGSAEIGAHIHGFAGPGVPAGILFNLALGSPKAVNWNFSEAQEANIIAGLTYFNIHTSGFPGGEIRGQIERVPSCGDGVLDVGEDCDDGNNADGDCCTDTCHFDAFGYLCPAPEDPCLKGICDGAGTCGVSAPRTGCYDALKSALTLSDGATDDKDKLIWKWLKGDQTTQEEFGVPTGTTSHTLCLFAGTAATFIGSATLPPGSMWSPISDKGYKFKDPTGTPDGLQKAVLKGGAQGKAKIIVKGKGANLPDMLGASLPLPVIVQLGNEGTCFEGQYDSGDIKKNDGAQFKAKAQ